MKDYATAKRRVGKMRPLVQRALSKRDAGPLRDLLESDTPLSADDREALSWGIQQLVDELPVRPGRPRAMHAAEYVAAETVLGLRRNERKGRKRLPRTTNSNTRQDELIAWALSHVAARYPQLKEQLLDADGVAHDRVRRILSSRSLLRSYRRRADDAGLTIEELLP